MSRRHLEEICRQHPTENDHTTVYGTPLRELTKDQLHAVVLWLNGRRAQQNENLMELVTEITHRRQERRNTERQT